MNAPINFHLDQLGSLVNGKITALARSGKPEDSDSDEYYGLVITLPNGQSRTLILLSDDEGNAPGSFEIHTEE